MELYIHIPFCVRKCTYCSFTSFPGCSQQEMERYLFAVLREAQLRKHEINEPLETVYIGGGTPSLIPAELFCSFLSELKTILDFSRVHEFTTEANPGTVTPAWLDTAVSQGINRISFGVQAFQDQILQTLGRIHRSCDVAASVKAARESGIDNISLDLMFGIPGQKAEDWAETLHFALSLCPDHISAYGLIPEDGTPCLPGWIPVSLNCRIRIQNGICMTSVSVFWQKTDSSSMKYPIFPGPDMPAGIISVTGTRFRIWGSAFLPPRCSALLPGQKEYSVSEQPIRTHCMSITG